MKLEACLPICAWLFRFACVHCDPPRNTERFLKTCLLAEPTSLGSSSGGLELLENPLWGPLAWPLLVFFF